MQHDYMLHCNKYATGCRIPVSAGRKGRKRRKTGARERVASQTDPQTTPVGRREVRTPENTRTRVSLKTQCLDGREEDLAVLAVQSEPLSGPKFPANREFNSEIVRFWTLVLDWRRGIPHNSQGLTRSGRPPRLKNNRDFFQRNSEMKFPVTGSNSESFQISCHACREKRPRFPTTWVGSFLKLLPGLVEIIELG
jgi:hypothetical protein